MDRASQVLSDGLPPDVRRTYAALADLGNVSLSTLHHRAAGWRSREQKAQSQQYLDPSEEKAPVKFLLQLSDLGSPVVTPMTSKALLLMHNQIAKDARDLEETSKQRLERHVQKLTNAARISFAESALLRDQNRFLYNLNNEAKVRRSTKRAVVGKAKVMSYGDIKEARAKRAAKEEAKVATKGKCGRKRKIPSLTIEVAPPRLTAPIAKMV